MNLPAQSQRKNTHDEKIATLERRDYDDRINEFRITYKDGRLVDLPNTADVSEQLEEPRVFVIEVSIANGFFTFGGEIAYWVSADMTEISVLIYSVEMVRRNTGSRRFWSTAALIVAFHLMTKRTFIL
jgi:hypothetical protein